MTKPSFDQIKSKYAVMWQEMKLASTRTSQIRIIASRILASKTRYQKVAEIVKRPWWFIACLHYRESSLNFHGHLHNGDPLTQRTTHVPAGKPTHGSPPFTWEESAIDALSSRSIPAIESIEAFAYGAEDYNGWGYWMHGYTSSYLWAWSNQHALGKFTADHHYDATVEDKQCGVMPILDVLMSMDGSIKFGPALESTSEDISSAQEHPAWAKLVTKWIKLALHVLLPFIFIPTTMVL
jgi:lysozyme family protein